MLVDDASMFVDGGGGVVVLVDAGSDASMFGGGGAFTLGGASLFVSETMPVLLDIRVNG